MSAAYRQTLKRLSLKVTPKRVALLEILADEMVYLCPEEIWRRMQRRFSTIGLPTVYRNLEELAEGGVISKVLHPDRKLYYYYCANSDHHHHFICLSCRRVEDVAFCAERELTREVTEKIRGKVLSHILQINGLCRRCLPRSRRRSHAS